MDLSSFGQFYFLKFFQNHSFHVILRPIWNVYMAKFTEEDKLMRRIGQRFNKGVVKYRLIDDNDKILIGLSGGKDSLALLELLAKRSRILKP